MIERVQQTWIDLLLEPLARLAEPFSQKHKQVLFVLSGCLIILTHFFHAFWRNGGHGVIPYLYIFVWDCFLLGLMTLAVLKPGLKPISFDRSLLLLGGSTGVSILVAGITKDPSHLAAALLALCIYPAIYLIWGNVNFSDICKGLIQSNRIAFVIALIIFVAFYPAIEAQYSAFFYNPNGLAFYLTAVLCCLWTSLLVERSPRLFWIDAILFGFGVALLYDTNSRTGQLSVVVAILGSLILFFIQDVKCAVTFCRKRLVVILLLALLIVFTHLYLFNGLIAIRNSIMSNESMWDAIIEQIREANKVWGKVQYIQTEKTEIGTRTALRYSSGRVDIWKGYLQNLRMTGHSYQDYFYFCEEGNLTRNSSAHNMFLEFSWCYGIPSGLCLLLFHLIAGIKSICYALKNRTEPYALFVLIIALAYGVTSMLSTVNSFLYMICLLYWLVQVPVMRRPLPSIESAEK